jgi:hypothetical protein
MVKGDAVTFVVLSGGGVGADGQLDRGKRHRNTAQNSIEISWIALPGVSEGSCVGAGVAGAVDTVGLSVRSGFVGTDEVLGFCVESGDVGATERLGSCVGAGVGSEDGAVERVGASVPLEFAVGASVLGEWDNLATSILVPPASATDTSTRPIWVAQLSSKERPGSNANETTFPTCT